MEICIYALHLRDGRILYIKPLDIVTKQLEHLAVGESIIIEKITEREYMHRITAEESWKKPLLSQPSLVF